MVHYIENQYLKIGIDHMGAQLWSIQSKASGQEYLWQGDKASWPDRAINLFPICCRLTDGCYTYQGKTYEMDIHGFLMSNPTEVAFHTADSITFRLCDNEKTRIQYPFAFQLDVVFALRGATLQVAYDVTNRSDVTMPFAIGGHPGFQVPFDDGGFSDYDLQFDQSSTVKAIALTADCFVTDQRICLPLEKGRNLHLTHGLFDNDALVLEDCPRSVTLKRRGGTKSITLSFPQMKYLGIWQMPFTNAKYVCIEPWTGLPSAAGVVDDLETKTNLHHLPAGESTQYAFSIQIQE
ncbi:MAG: aldose 1-epimerase family protein [Eubacteriales bacterium]